MAQRDASLPQLDFPELVADIISNLRLTGQLGLLNYSDTVIPVDLVSTSRPFEISVVGPSFPSAGALSGSNKLPVANTVVLDTGQLPAGTYDICAHIQITGRVAAGSAFYRLEHRNAANSATLAELITGTISAVDEVVDTTLPIMGCDIAANERLRVLSPDNVMGVGAISANLFFQKRPTP